MERSDPDLIGQQRFKRGAFHLNAENASSELPTRSVLYLRRALSSEGWKSSEYTQSANVHFRCVTERNGRWCGLCDRYDTTKRNSLFRSRLLFKRDGQLNPTDKRASRAFNILFSTRNHSLRNPDSSCTVLVT